MAAVFLSPIGGAGAQFFDNNGVPLVGGKLHSYAAGTTTPVVTYTTAAGGVPHSNPIILDSGGRVPSGGEVWLAQGSAVKIVLATSTDVVLATWDILSGVNDVPQTTTSAGIVFTQSGIGAVSRTAQSKMQDVVSVMDFGAIGDGIADDTAAFSAAFAYTVTMGSGTVMGGVGKTHRITSGLTIATPDFTFNGNNCAIDCAISTGDPLFNVVTEAVSGVTLSNFTATALSAACGHCVSATAIIATPINLELSSVHAVGFSGNNAKDALGVAMPASLFYGKNVKGVSIVGSGAGNGAAGVWVDQCSSVGIHLSCDFTNLSSNGVRATGCNSVSVSGSNSFTRVGAVGAPSVYIDGSQSVTVETNTFVDPADLAVGVMNTPSNNITIRENKVSTSATVAISSTTAVNSLNISNNDIRFVGGVGPFEAGVRIVDNTAPTVEIVAPVVSGNRVFVEGAATLTSGVSLMGATAAASVAGNTIGGDPTGTIIHGIGITGVGRSNTIEGNALAYPGGAMSSGIVIGANQINSVVGPNTFSNGVTTQLANAGSGTRREDNQTFLATLLGCTPAPTGFLRLDRNGLSVTLRMPVFTGASSGTSCGINGLPAEFIPSVSQIVPVIVIDNGVSVMGSMIITNNGQINIWNGAPFTPFTLSGTKGLDACCVTYLLN